ncbi:MAG: 5-bromo-4-chloroindolyl phosphate hydrolysis family protein [Oscillospiraceae bacterium]|nr:5-bromo-4-chloroindolyl phosphate hydrolysis family protein [Oscillospiraceae bacterium]
MNDFNNGNNNNKDARNTLEWVGIVLAFIVWWPVGLIWLILKLARPSRRNANSFNQNRQSAPDFSAYQSSAPKQTYAAPVRPAAEKKKKEKKEKMPQDIAALVLLILGCVFLFIGLASLLEFVNYDILSDLREALFYLIGGGASMFFSWRAKRKAKRLSKYIAVMGMDDCKSVAEISKATGLARERVRKDLEYMAQKGYFGETAYLDNGLDSLVISEAAAEKEREIRQQSRTEKKASDEREANTSEYMRIYEQMREAAGNIKDPEISAKMMRLTELTGKILQAAEANPEKEKNIRRFMSYYLPQTQKLMRSYAVLERQGISTANISSTKERIGNILDNLITGYEQQLDQMFDSDAMDISSDIDVLETMLKQDGLNSDGSGIAMGGH